jgi:hypothetical protein
VKPLPTLRQLAADLRAINAAWSHPDAGPCPVCLTLDGEGFDECEWRALPSHMAAGWQHFGWEEVPGATSFDATGAARRLLAAARDAGFR